MTIDDIRAELGWTDFVIHSLLQDPDSPHVRRDAQRPVRGTMSGGIRQTGSIGPYSCSTTTHTIASSALPGSDCRRVHHHGQLGERSPSPARTLLGSTTTSSARTFPAPWGWVQNGVGGGTYYNNGLVDAANHPGNWNVQCNSNGQWLYVVLGPYNGASTASITILASCLVTTPDSTAGGTTAFGWFDNTGNTTPNGVYGKLGVSDRLELALYGQHHQLHEKRA